MLQWCAHTCRMMRAMLTLPHCQQPGRLVFCCRLCQWGRTAVQPLLQSPLLAMRPCCLAVHL